MCLKANVSECNPKTEEPTEHFYLSEYDSTPKRTILDRIVPSSGPSWVPHVSGLHVGSWVGSLMSKDLKRYYGRGYLSFVTFRCPLTLADILLASW